MVEKRKFTGTRQQIIDAITAAVLPRQWGDSNAVKEWAKWHIPDGRGWSGDFQLSGYHTPANGDGTGTAFISCAWSPHTEA